MFLFTGLILSAISNPEIYKLIPSDQMKNKDSIKQILNKIFKLAKSTIQPQKNGSNSHQDNHQFFSKELKKLENGIDKWVHSEEYSKVIDAPAISNAIQNKSFILIMEFINKNMDEITAVTSLEENGHKETFKGTLPNVISSIVQI